MKTVRILFVFSMMLFVSIAYSGIAGEATEAQPFASEFAVYAYPLAALITVITLLVGYKSWRGWKYPNSGRTHQSVSNQKIPASPDEAVVRVGRSLEIEYCNPVACQIFDRDETQIVGQKLKELLVDIGASEPDIAGVLSMIKKQFREPGYGLVYGDFSLPGQRESTVFQVSSSPILNKRNRVVGAALFGKDHAEQSRLVAKLMGQAERDHLTGLVNRMGFDKYIEEFPEAARPGAKNVLCYLDLDNFKPVNDSAGHTAGDQLLKHLADIFRQHVRSSDLLARTGGDEFVILFPACPIEKAQERLENIINSVSSFRFSWGDKSFVVGVSIGAVEFDSDITVAGLNDLSKIADEACYQAKQKGRNQLHITDPSQVIDGEEHMGKDNWPSIIRDALDKDKFELFVQPILALNQADQAEDEKKRFEVYLRLPFNGRTLRPGTFFPAAERYGLSPAIDRWVISRSMEKLAELNARDTEPVSREFTINLSASSVMDSEVGGYIQSELNRLGLNASQFCFEVSESDVVSNFVEARKLLEHLATMGCSNSLDDFGSGLSALNYIRDLPLHYLKIDGVFVRNIETNQIDAAMIHSLNHMSKVMNLKTVAEFVEDEDTAKLLRRLGVDYAQGYYCGRPLPLERMEAANKVS